MRSELGKECRKLFRQMMDTEFPDYREDKGQLVPQGWYVWTYAHPSGLFFHILLVNSPKQDMVTAEVGWSAEGRLKSSTSLEGREVFKSRPDRMRIGRALPEGGGDRWWVLALNPVKYQANPSCLDLDPIEECLPLVAPAMRDVADKLKQHIVPLFDEIMFARS